MPDRADALQRIRPAVPVDTHAAKAVEAFQHETLRPILKLQNPLILLLVASYAEKYTPRFVAFDVADQRRAVRDLLKQDSRLKRTLTGMITGHFTEDEFRFYLAHAGEVRRRITALLLQRVDDQIEALSTGRPASEEA